MVTGGKRRTASGSGFPIRGKSSTPAWPEAATLPKRFEKGWRQIHQARRGIDTLARRNDCRASLRSSGTWMVES